MSGHHKKTDDDNYTSSPQIVEVNNSNNNNNDGDEMTSVKTSFIAANPSPTGGGPSSSPTNAFTIASPEEMQRKAEAAQTRTLIRRIVTGSTLLAMLVLFIRQAKGNYSDIFLYHPTAMAISSLGLMPEAISLAMQAKHVKGASNRCETVQSHVLVSFACKFVALAGYLAIWKSKVERGKHHYTTWHGKVGLAAGLVLFAQVILGALQFFSVPISMTQRMWYRKMHKYLGSVLGALFAASFGLGFASNYAHKLFGTGDQWMLVLCGSSCGLAILWSLFRE